MWSVCLWFVCFTVRMFVVCVFHGQYVVCGLCVLRLGCLWSVCFTVKM